MSNQMGDAETKLAHHIAEAIEATAIVNAKMEDAPPSIIIAAMMVALVKSSFLYSKEGHEKLAIEGIITSMRKLHEDIAEEYRGTLQ